MKYSIVTGEDTILTRLSNIAYMSGQEEGRKRTMVDLLKSPNMRAKTLILFYNWFANAFAYFGLSLNMGQVSCDWWRAGHVTSPASVIGPQLTGGADIFLNFTVSGLLEIPAYLAAILILRCWGRRSALIGGAWSRDTNAPL